MVSGKSPRSFIGSIASKYVKLMDRLEKLILGVSICIFIALTALTVGSVLSRQFLGFVPAWSGELQRYLAIWMTLLLAGALTNSDSHLSVRFTFKYLSDSIVYILRLFQLGVILLIGVIFINWGTKYVLDSGTASVSPSMGFQMGWVYIVLPITGWLFVLFSISRGIKIYSETNVEKQGADLSDDDLLEKRN